MATSNSLSKQKASPPGQYDFGYGDSNTEIDTGAPLEALGFGYDDDDPLPLGDEYEMDGVLPTPTVVKEEPVAYGVDLSNNQGSLSGPSNTRGRLDSGYHIVLLL